MKKSAIPASRKRPRGRSKNHRRLNVEALEQRLALTWLGVPPSFVAVPTISVGVTLNSQADASGSASIASTEVDYYSFTASRTGAYTISASTPNSSVDTVLGVFSASGQRLAYNDDIATSNTDSRLTINLTAGSRYYVGITNYTSSSRGSYVWAIDGPNSSLIDDAYENNDTFETAANFGALSATRTVSQLVMADTQDWYRFTTTAMAASSSSVSIAFQNSQGNLQLSVYDSAGNLVGTSQGTGNSESVALGGRAAGDYFVVVYGSGGATNPSYSLSVKIASAPTTPTTPPAATGGFEITLSMSGLTASQQAIFQQAADRWEQAIVGDLPNATYRGQVVDDLLIEASAPTIDGAGGILGQAGPDAMRSASRLPYHGVMQFDAADMASMERSGLLLSVVMHEMGHILGIGTVWQSLGLLTSAGSSNPLFVGAQATAAYNQLMSTSASGVPVEATGGPGTADAHWRESTFSGELMTGWAGPGTNLPLSVITIGSLADIGYSVNYAAADTYIRSLSSAALASIASATRTQSSVRSAGLMAMVASFDVSLPSMAGRHDVHRDFVAFASDTATSAYAAAVDLLLADSEGGGDIVSSGSRAELPVTPHQDSIAWEHFGLRRLDEFSFATGMRAAAARRA